MGIKLGLGFLPQFDQVFHSFDMELNKYPISLRSYPKVEIVLLSS